MSRENQIAGFVGRFQPFHLGHYKVVEKYREKFQEFTLIIGSSSESGTEENPLSFEDRKEIIEACFPDLEIVGVEDTEKDSDWARKMEDLDLEVVLSGNSWVKEALQDSAVEVIEPEVFDPNIYSGTEVRRRIKSKEEWRYLVPGCSESQIEEKLEKIQESGINYEFEPGWKRENSYHSTADK